MTDGLRVQTLMTDGLSGVALPEAAEAVSRASAGVTEGVVPEYNYYDAND
jgi:hypothetical protein